MILLGLLMCMLENTCPRNSSGRQDFQGTELEFLWLIIYLTYIRLIGFFFLIMGRSLKMAHWRSFLRRVTLHPKTSVPSPPPDGVSSPPPPPIPSPHLTLPIPSMHLYYEEACPNVMVSSHFLPSGSGLPAAVETVPPHTCQWLDTGRWTLTSQTLPTLTFNTPLCRVMKTESSPLRETKRPMLCFRLSDHTVHCSRSRHWGQC